MNPVEQDESPAASSDAEGAAPATDTLGGPEEVEQDDVVDFAVAESRTRARGRKRRDATFALTLTAASLLHAAVIFAGVAYVRGHPTAGDAGRGGGDSAGPQAVTLRHANDESELLADSLPVILFPPSAEADTGSTPPRLSPDALGEISADVAPRPSPALPDRAEDEPLALGLSSRTPPPPVRPRPAADSAVSIGGEAAEPSEPSPAGAPGVPASGATPVAAPSFAGGSPEPATVTAPRPRGRGGSSRRGGSGTDERGLPIPEYPAESRRRGEQGVVVVEVHVRADGSVADVSVVSDGGYPRLARAAVDAARAATFDPGTRGGKAEAATIRIPYQFVIR